MCDDLRRHSEFLRRMTELGFISVNFTWFLYSRVGRGVNLEVAYSCKFCCFSGLPVLSTQGFEMLPLWHNWAFKIWPKITEIDPKWDKKYRFVRILKFMHFRSFLAILGHKRDLLSILMLFSDRYLFIANIGLTNNQKYMMLKIKFKWKLCNLYNNMTFSHFGVNFRQFLVIF